MKITAQVRNGDGNHVATVSTSGTSRVVDIPPKPAEQGGGSAVNGGELLFLALATCYCNDVYREAVKRGIAVDAVEVDVSGEFGAAGEPATNVTYRARVVADASADEIRELMTHVDTVAEIQNTLRVPTPVTLTGIEAISRNPGRGGDQE